MDQELIDASKDGDINKVKQLIEQGAHIHAKNDLALVVASRYGHLDIIKFLTEKGANTRVRDDYALVEASKKGYTDIVKFLIEKGANVNARNHDALKWASINRYGHLDVIEILLDNGADIHANNDEALREVYKRHYAHGTYSRDPSKWIEVIKYLIKRGANWKLIDSNLKDLILKEESNDLKNKLTSSYLTLNQIPELKSGSDNRLLLKTIYEAPYSELCSKINSNIPPLRLIALANLMKLEYDVDISWLNLCDKMKKTVYLML